MSKVKKGSPPCRKAGPCHSGSKIRPPRCQRKTAKFVPRGNFTRIYTTILSDISSISLSGKLSTS
jgi:hypothetical protein